MRDRNKRDEPGSSDEDYLAFLRGAQARPAPRPQPARPQPPRHDPARPASRRDTEEPHGRGRHRLTRRLSRPLLVGTVAAATLTVLIAAGVTLAPRTGTPRSGDRDTSQVAVLDLADASAVAPDANTDAAASPTPSASPTPRTSKSPRPTGSPAPRPARTTTAPAPSTSSAPPAATTTGGSGDDHADERRQILTLVNAERAKAGCGNLSAHSRLTTAAQRHSEDQAAHRNMAHEGSDGSNVGTRVTRAGYTWRAVAENVAMGYRTHAEVMQGWMNSPGHRRNILNCTYRHLGVGVAEGGGSLYWTQVFATS
ncbi:CAP domain-containing protein [Micromonosporaceae bacterium DT55]|uniref:CAP domain-containing protein n=1 Tax=Melissospora conviva TaxID=3388432 RepID=UPI003C2491DC